VEVEDLVIMLQLQVVEAQVQVVQLGVHLILKEAVTHLQSIQHKEAMAVMELQHKILQFLAVAVAEPLEQVENQAQHHLYLQIVEE
tara:strand:+ start:191 stop:448 length:258 start_codon:yes stop_codon:yes gene_type:complete